MEWVFQPQTQSSRMWGTLALRWKFHNIGSWIRRCEFYNLGLGLKFYNPVSSSAPRCELGSCNHGVNILENSRSEIYAHANCPKVQFGDRFSGAIGDMHKYWQPHAFSEATICVRHHPTICTFLSQDFLFTYFGLFYHLIKGKIGQKYLFTSSPCAYINYDYVTGQLQQWLWWNWWWWFPSLMCTCVVYTALY